MSSVKVKVSRKEALAQKFYALAPAAQKANVDAALKSAEEVLATAQRFVRVKSGYLKRSGRARLLHEGDGRVAAIVGFTAPHAHLVEFGTAERTQKTTHRATGAARKQPYLFPAYRLYKSRIKSRFARGLNKAAKAIAAR